MMTIMQQGGGNDRMDVVSFQCPNWKSAKREQPTGGGKQGSGYPVSMHTNQSVCIILMVSITMTMTTIIIQQGGSDLFSS
jgi:hypothetical protein